MPSVDDPLSIACSLVPAHRARARSPIGETIGGGYRAIGGIDMVESGPAVGQVAWKICGANTL
jgi:hypothetical protein